MATPQVERRAWRVQDFAEAYGISRPMAYKLMAAGKLDYVQHGSQLRLIAVDAAERWLHSGSPAIKAAEARP